MDAETGGGCTPTTYTPAATFTFTVTKQSLYILIKIN